MQEGNWVETQHISNENEAVYIFTSLSKYEILKKFDPFPFFFLWTLPIEKVRNLHS